MHRKFFCCHEFGATKKLAPRRRCATGPRAKKYLQKKAVEEYEVIYQNNALVKAILHQDLSSTAITIHKYEYTFRP